MPGKIIALEGGDLCGKSTVFEMLATMLPHYGLKVATLVFPTRRMDDGIGYAIRDILKNSTPDLDAMELLYAADKQLQQATIKEMLENNDIVLLDRYWYSGIAFAMAKAQCSTGDIDEANRWIGWVENINSHLIKPDLSIYIDLPHYIRITRAKNANQRDAYEKNGELQKAVDGTYNTLLHIYEYDDKSDLPPLVKVDAFGRTPGDIYDEIIKIIKGYGYMSTAKPVPPKEEESANV